MIEHNIEKKEDKNLLIVQHNHLVEAKYHFTLQEKRLMCWLASQVKPTDEDFKEHALSIKEFAKLVEVRGDHLYKALEEITHKLMQKIITIKSLTTREFVKAALLGGAKYNEGQGIIKLSFHPYLKPYILQLKERFTKINLEDVLGLKSVYAIRIYELLKQYEVIGIRQLSLEGLRECCGIPKERYKKFNDFKKDVLERAKREINNKTDIFIDYEEMKTSRKITDINFVIKPNSNYGQTEFEKAQAEKAAILAKEYRSELALIERMGEYGFARLTSKKFIQNHGEEVVKNALRSVDLQVERGHVKNPKAMLQIAIKDKWHPEKYIDRKKKRG